MQDPDIIDAAYATALGDLYKVLMISYTAAGGNRTVERQADEAFRAGVGLARKVRDRARALVA